VVFADADLDAAAKEVGGQFVNAGQVCLAGTRVLVEESVAQDFLARVTAATERLPVGDPRDLATRIGPLITHEHFERVAGFVEREGGPWSFDFYCDVKNVAVKRETFR